MPIKNVIFDFLIQKHQLSAGKRRDNTADYLIEFQSNQHSAVYLSSEELAEQSCRPVAITLNGIVYPRGKMHLTVEANYDEESAPYHETTEYFLQHDPEKNVALKLRVFYDFEGKYKNYHLQQQCVPVSYVDEAIDMSDVQDKRGPFLEILQLLIDEQQEHEYRHREQLKTENEEKLSALDNQFKELEQVIAEKMESLNQASQKEEILSSLKILLDEVLSILRQGDKYRRNLGQQQIAQTHLFNQFLNAINNYTQPVEKVVTAEDAPTSASAVNVSNEKKNRSNHKDKKRVAREKSERFNALITEISGQYAEYLNIKKQQMRELLTGLLRGNIEPVKQLYNSPYLADKIEERFEGFLRIIEKEKNISLLEKQIQVSHFLFKNSAEYRRIIADRGLSFGFSGYGVAKRVLFELYLSNNALAFQMFLEQKLDPNADAILFQRELRLFNLLPCIMIDILLKGTFSEKMDVDLCIEQFIDTLLKHGAKMTVRSTSLNEKVILGKQYASTEFGLGKSGGKKKLSYGFREKASQFFQSAADNSSAEERENYGLLYAKMFDELIRGIENENGFIWLVSLVKRLKIQTKFLSNVEEMKQFNIVMSDSERESEIFYAERQLKIVLKILFIAIKYIDLETQINSLCYFAQTEAIMNIHIDGKKICSIAFVDNQEDSEMQSVIDRFSNTVKDNFLSLSIQEQQIIIKKTMNKEAHHNQKGFFAMAQFLISIIEEPTLRHYDSFFSIIALRYRNNIYSYQQEVAIDSAPMMMLKVAFYLKLSEEQRVALSDPNSANQLEGEDITAYAYLTEKWKEFPELFVAVALEEVADSKEENNLLKSDALPTSDDETKSSTRFFEGAGKNILWQPAPTKKPDTTEPCEEEKFAIV